MYAKMDHVAINVNNFKENVRFFEEVFGMEVEKATGEKPARKIWFRQGIQLNETAEDVCCEGIMDHVGIRTDCKEIVLAKSKEFGCKGLPNGEHWFQTPGGIKIELK